MRRFLLSICVLILASQATSTSTFWFEIPTAPIVDPQKPLSNLKDFLNGFFTNFSLDFPSQIFDCFNRDTAILFFEDLQESFDIVTYMNRKYALALRSEYFKRPLFPKIEPHAAVCVALTKDLSSLFQKLNIDFLDPKTFSQGNFLYYQAHYDRLLEDFNPVMSNIGRDQFEEAGRAYARLIEHIVVAVQTEGWGYLAFKAYMNGVGIGLGLEELSFSPEEVDEQTANQVLWLIQHLGSAEVEDDWETFDKAREFIKERQKERLTGRGKEMRERLGGDVFKAEFYRKIVKYKERHELNFGNHMSLMNEYFNKLHMIMAGEKFGKIIQDAAAADL